MPHRCRYCRKHFSAKLQARGRSHTKPTARVLHKIPILTFAEWQDAKTGEMQTRGGEDARVGAVRDAVGMFRDPGLGIRGMGTAASVELIAVSLVLGCVDLFGARARYLVEHLPVGGRAGAINVRLLFPKPGADQGSAAVQKRIFLGDAQRGNRRLPAHRQWREPATSHSFPHEEQQVDPQLLDHIIANSRG